MVTRTEPTFAFGEIGGGGLAAASRAGVALRSTSRTHAPSCFALGAVIPGGDMSAMPMLLTAPVRAAACLLLSAVGGYCVTHKKPRVRRRRP